MATLTSSDKRKLERLFQMGGGYVLSFSDRTFQEFVDEAVHRNIYEERFRFNGTSKAKHMRAFWAVESNHIVGKLILHLIVYIVDEKLEHDAELREECRKIGERLVADTGVADVEVLAEIGDERDFEAVAAAVRDAIERGEPATGLDRLHTFATKYLRTLCEKRGITVERGKALHSLMGEYRRHLHDAGKLESEMTGKILKASAQLLQDFNDVRNNQSLAHDNPILNHDEALLIFNSMTSTIRFLREMDKRLEREEAAAKEAAAAAEAFAPVDDDIPF